MTIIGNAVTIPEGITPPEPPAYLTFRERNGLEFDLVGYHVWDGTLEYSTDTETWETWEGESYTSNSVSSENGVLYLRGVENTIISLYDDNDYMVYGFSFSGDENLQIDCIGNIETLLDYTEVLAGDHPVMGINCFTSLFQNCYQLCSAPELPATTLAEGCYNSMFYGCTSLTTASQLPATTLAPSCYARMFYGCTSLTTAPELPATTLTENCYHGMFNGCTSLTTAPQLSATTLAENCYNSMFYGCTSLNTVPELPATTLELGCYASMFCGCTSLTTVPQLPATTLAESCYPYMFTGCTSLYVNTTRTSASQTEFRIPTSGTGTNADNALSSMFNETSGSFAGTPTINTTYYIGQGS